MSTQTAPWTVDTGIHLLPDESEIDLHETIRAILGSAGDIEDIRRIAATDRGFSPDLWRELTESMAVTTMAVPESVGGLGYGLQYLSAVIEECGRALRPEPVLSSAAVGIPAVLLGHDDRLEPLRSAALSGSLLVTTTSLSVETDRLHASGSPSGWTIDGDARLVDRPDADVVIATARTAAGQALFAIPVTDGARLRALPSIDPTRTQASLSCRSAPAILLADPTTSAGEVARLRIRAIIALAAENVGIVDRLFEMTCEYTRSRQQFGRPIASYQAIKHRLADMFLDVERARSAARYAAAFHDAAEHDSDGARSDLADLELAASVAGAVCGDAAIRVATEAIQLHGGIGFTWEHPAHSYYRRVLTNETLFGSPSEHRQRIAALATSRPADTA